MRARRGMHAPRVLYVVHGVPRVPAPGGATRAYHLLRGIARVAEVDALCVVEPSDRSETDSIVPYCRSVSTVAAPRARTEAVDPIRKRLALQPRVLWRFDHGPLRRTMERLLGRDRFDVIVVEHTEIAEAVHDIVERYDARSVADLHNVLSVHEARTTQPAGPVERLRAALRVDQIRTLERRILRAYSTVTCVSAVDRAHLAAVEPEGQVSVVPNGVDMRYFGVVTPDRAGDRAVFTGALWYRPNVDGLTLFASEIWPRVRARRPNAKIALVGARPGREVRALADLPGVSVHGSVPDVRPFLAGAAAAVVPLRLGTGTRLKILEALAAHLPVVSTGLGAEGLELQPDVDFLLADDPGDFARGLTRLLAEPSAAAELALAGNRMVRRRYAWEVIVPRFQRAVLGDDVMTTETQNEESA